MRYINGSTNVGLVIDKIWIKRAAIAAALFYAGMLVQWATA